MDSSLWLIWSIEHEAWWHRARVGYTKLRREAGTYTYEDAVEIVNQANIVSGNVPNEAMVPYNQGV